MIRKLRAFLKWLLIGFNEWRFGISSEDEVFLQKFGINDADCHQYNATNYIWFRQMMHHVKIRAGEDVFLDFGSGMGRVVVLAATYPFRKVLGVELIEELNAKARENVRNAMPRLKCRDIELHTTDAGEYQIPPEVTFIYFWNPFSGKLLARVFSNIRASIVQTPRAVTILYVTPPEYTHLDDIKDQLPWLKVRQRLKLGKDTRGMICTCGPEV